MTTKKTTKKTDKRTTRRRIGKTKEQREGAMMSELCQEHGYTFVANRPSDRMTLMFSYDPELGSKRLVSMYTLQLAVPMDSALGKQMLEQFPIGKKKT